MNANTRRVAGVEDARSRRQVRVRFDDGTELVVPRPIGVALHAGAALLPGAFDELRHASNAEARTTAVRYLRSAERTAAEVRQKLRECGFGQETIDAAASWLAERGLVDDSRAAEAHIERRGSRQARSTRMLRAELRSRGVDGSTLEVAVAAVDDETSARAYCAGRGAPRRGEAYDSYVARVGGALLRRGFSRGLALRVLRDRWEQDSSGSEL